MRLAALPLSYRGITAPGRIRTGDQRFIEVTLSSLPHKKNSAEDTGRRNGRPDRSGQPAGFEPAATSLGRKCSTR